MVRKSRLDTPGALHHIILRGIERRKIFWDDGDRENFLERLGTILADTQTPCYGWALIPNHVHLLVRTGIVPIATVMRRLLTGYAVSFNRRHKRHGHLFQNRYKSIMCQEDAYLLELVRYVHLNPLRARLVADMEELDRYPYCGHSVVMDKELREWQDVKYVLALFGRNVSQGRQGYREFVENGISQGSRPDLMGGGLLRSMGGWTGVKARGETGERIKGDERILGDTEFVNDALRRGEEKLEQRYRYRARGYDLGWLANRVAELLEIDVQEILKSGKYPRTVQARSVFCYFAVRELGYTTVQLAKHLGLSQPTISQAVVRGEQIAAEIGIQLTMERNQ